MRFVAVLAGTLLLATAACGGDGLEEDAAATQSDLVNGGDYSACSLSRSSILASTSPARQRAIRRGFAWLDANVQYSQAASHEGYRTDCSGFVAMCWELGSSPNTAAYLAGNGKATALASYDELLPGDAFIRSGHAAMFLGWEDAAQTSACIIELASTASDMKFRARTTSALRSSGAKAFRADYLANDLGTPKATEQEPTPPPPPPAPPPATNDDPAEDPEPTPPPSQPEPETDDETNPPPPSAEEEAEGAYEVPLQPSQSEGDPGDDDEPRTTSKKKRSRASGVEPIGNAGCSAAPGSAATGTGIPLLAALLAASVVSRRVRRSRA